MTEEKMIMIVDDVKANRFLLRNIISDMGYKPILAENGIQALNILEKIKPNLILLDVAMPEMDGYELCRIIKKDVNKNDIPIIFISAYDQPTDIIRGFEIGGEDYITKPFIQEVVKARVNVHIKLSDMNNNLSLANKKLASAVQEQLAQKEREKKTVLYALVRVAQANSSYNEQYMGRLRHNCKVLAQALQLSPQYESRVSDKFIETIEVAAPLCDIGNVAIPTEILQKKGILTEEEMEIVRTHTVIGAKILEDIKKYDDFNDFIDMSLQVAKYHHENWDGSGYPEGISGDDIPLAAQIVSLVSVYCALTEDRFYRASFTREETFEILSMEAGSKYNLVIFEICEKISKQFI